MQSQQSPGAALKGPSIETGSQAAAPPAAVNPLSRSAIGTCALAALPVRVYAKGRDLSYAACSDAFASDLGLGADAILGRTDNDLFGIGSDSPCNREEEEVMRTGASRIQDRSYSDRGKTVWIRTLRAPVRDAAGAIEGMVGVILDVTAERRSEELRMEATAGLKQIWSFTDEAVLIIDVASGTLVDLNPSATRLARFAREELLGRHHSTLYRDVTRRRADDLLRSALIIPGKAYPLSLARRDGDAGQVRFSVTRAFGAQGRQSVVAFLRGAEPSRR